MPFFCSRGEGVRSITLCKHALRCLQQRNFEGQARDYLLNTCPRLYWAETKKRVREKGSFAKLYLIQSYSMKTFKA